MLSSDMGAGVKRTKLRMSLELTWHLIWHTEQEKGWTLFTVVIKGYAWLAPGLRVIRKKCDYIGECCNNNKTGDK